MVAAGRGEGERETDRQIEGMQAGYTAHQVQGGMENAVLPATDALVDKGGGPRELGWDWIPLHVPSHRNADWVILD